MKLPGRSTILFLCLYLTTLLSKVKNASSADAATAATATATVASKSVLESLKHLDYRYFVAGGTCAAISHGITTPIDVVKTKIQANPKKYDKGMIKAAADIWKTDGANALLGGLGPTIVGYGIEGAMKFGVYEVMKPILADLLSLDSTTVAYLLASVVAGAVAAILLCPMESTRIRIVTDPAYADKGLLSGLPKLIAEEGLLSTFAGIWAMLAKQVPYTLGKQVSFDVFATSLYQFFENVKQNVKLLDGQIKWAVSILAAFAASLVACIFSQPGDMILTETYRPPKKKQPTVTAAAPTTGKKKSGRNLLDRIRRKRKEVETKVAATSSSSSSSASSTSTTSFTGVVRTIHQQGGVPAFFTGTGARIVHVGVIITSQLVIYDIVKQLLGLPATGKH